ncbi:MAG: hypothetical protein DLM60_01165 [Pseudonocardiales bacterium]|nr:MAG: hypothetical protein DLM60_01165 [Pseudonocardiales bacterium]
MTQPTNESQPTNDRRRLVIHAACTCRGVANGFANVVVRKVDGQIELDPHVTGACVLTLAEDEAVALRDALTRWLG